jgi:hypothetical protein
MDAKIWADKNDLAAVEFVHESAYFSKMEIMGNNYIQPL